MGTDDPDDFDFDFDFDEFHEDWPDPDEWVGPDEEHGAALTTLGVDLDAVAAALAAAFLAGTWATSTLAARGSAAVGEHAAAWVAAVAAEVHQAVPDPSGWHPADLARVVRPALIRLDPPLGSTPRVPDPPDDEPTPRVRRTLHRPAPRWPVLPLPDVAALADRLELDEGRLAWLADVDGRERRARDERLRNYRYRWRERSGPLPRLIEQPKARLMESQRIVLREILDRIPAHDAAHGFRPGRSVRTHAAGHVGAAVVVRLDLEDFFASVGVGRIRGIFLAAGYDHAVAHTLTGLTTNVVAAGAWAARRPPAHAGLSVVARHHRLGRRLAAPHLPQGAPTSPALANLAAFGLDVRLSAYAATLGARYTRYADDLAFSGARRLGRAAPTLQRAVAAIARDEGFTLNPQKSRVMTQVQRQTLCSIVVNAHLNVPRDEYDRLKAILHDARHHGAAAANRDGHPDFHAHLAGRIAWVTSLHPDRGARLRERLALIDFGA